MTGHVNVSSLPVTPASSAFFCEMKTGRDRQMPESRSRLTYRYASLKAAGVMVDSPFLSSFPKSFWKKSGSMRREK